MKNKLLFSIVAIVAVILSACTQTSLLPSGGTEGGSTPTVVLATKTPVPTPTEKPAPTKDPNAPAEFTRHENGIYYLDVTTEKGNTLTYTYDTERKVYTTILLTGSFDPNIQENLAKGAHNMLPMIVQIDKTTVGADKLSSFLMHPNNNETYSWSTFFGTQRRKAFIKAGFFTASNVNYEPWWDGSHKFNYGFVTQDGRQSWGLWDDYLLNNGKTPIVRIRIRGDYTDLKANMSNNGFSEVSSTIASYGPVTDFMIKLSTENDNLYIDIAPDPSRSIADMPKKLLVWMFAYGPSIVMDNCADAPTSCDLTTLPYSSPMLDKLVLNEETYPWFDISSGK